VTSFEEASRQTYADPAFSKEVARKEFRLCRESSTRRLTRSSKFLIPRSRGDQAGSWKTDGHADLSRQRQGQHSFDQIIDNTFADKAVASLK